MVLSLALDLSHHRLITGEPQLLILPISAIKATFRFLQHIPKNKNPASPHEKWGLNNQPCSLRLWMLVVQVIIKKCELHQSLRPLRHSRPVIVLYMF